MIGTCLCILAVLPLFAVMMIDASDLVCCIAVGILLLLIAIAVVFFIVGGINWTSMEKLLQEGDYAREKKKRGAMMEHISTAYWLIITAVYLAYSFITNNWVQSWIIWPVAGVLYGAFAAVANIVFKHD